MIFDIAQTIGLVILILLIATFIHLAGTFILCRIYKINVETVQILHGKSILEFRFKNIKFTLGYIPTGGSIKHDHEDYQKRNLLTRISILFAGALFTFLSAAVLVGISASFNELIKGFQQIFNLILSPLDKGLGLIRSFKEYASINPFTVTYALLATKIAAANLLPIPPMNGGQILLEIIPFFNTIKRKVAATNIGFIIFLLLIIYGFISDLLPQKSKGSEVLEFIFKAIVQIGLWLPFILFDLVVPFFLYKQLNKEELKNDYKKRKEHRIMNVIVLIIFGIVTSIFGYAVNPYYYLANIPLTVFLIIFIFRK